MERRLGWRDEVDAVKSLVGSRRPLGEYTYEIEKALDPT